MPASETDPEMRSSRSSRFARPGLLVASVALAAAGYAPSAEAQFLKLTSGGNATLTGSIGGGVTTQSGSDDLLVTVVNFGEVGPNNPAGYVCLTQPLLIRSRFLFSRVRLVVTAESFGPGQSQIGKGDIGVGLINLRESGPNADISTTAIVPAFASNPCTAPKSADGIPTFAGTLADVDTTYPGTIAIVSDGPISERGSLSSPSNAAEVDLKLAIAPQAFRAGTFSVTLTLRMTIF